MTSKLMGQIFLIEKKQKMDTWQKGESGSLYFYFSPMDGAAHTVERQTKTHV